ncbi:MAG: hypothetical protein ACTHL8_17215, partial [Burkholderiaceae bacterium]
MRGVDAGAARCALLGVGGIAGSDGVGVERGIAGAGGAIERASRRTRVVVPRRGRRLVAPGRAGAVDGAAVGASIGSAVVRRAVAARAAPVALRRTGRIVPPAARQVVAARAGAVAHVRAVRAPGRRGVLRAIVRARAGSRAVVAARAVPGTAVASRPILRRAAVARAIVRRAAVARRPLVLPALRRTGAAFAGTVGARGVAAGATRALAAVMPVGGRGLVARVGGARPLGARVQLVAAACRRRR